MKIIVGVDGSEPALHAVEWCASNAEKLGAEVIAVHAIEIPVYAAGVGYCPVPVVYTPEQEDALKREMTELWCAALTRANVPFKTVVNVGYPTEVICEVVKSEDADLVVVGRRGRGGFAEFMLGSTSHQLAHHVGRPLVIVP